MTFKDISIGQAFFSHGVRYIKLAEFQNKHGTFNAIGPKYHANDSGHRLFSSWEKVWTL